MKADFFKKLMPLQVFLNHDGPRFYSCTDYFGQLFLAYWIDESEAGHEWLYIRISEGRYQSLKRGEISVRFALSNPEEGLSYLVGVKKGDVNVVEIEGEHIDQAWLPRDRFRLNIPENALPERRNLPLEAARAGVRHVLDVALERLSNAYEMSCGKFGRILESVQQTADAFACGRNFTGRKVPDDIKFQGELLISGLFQGSFGVRIESKGADLFESDKISSGLHSLVEYLGLVSYPSKLSELLHGENILARSRFKHLISVLKDAEVSIRVAAASPSNRETSGYASYAQLVSALAELEAREDSVSRVVEHTGRLVGVDVERDFFALAIGGDVLKGRLSAEMTKEHFKVPSLLKAKVHESCVVDGLTDREKWTFVLLSTEEI